MTLFGLFKHQLDYWLDNIFKLASIFGILTFTLQTNIQIFKIPLAIGFATTSAISLLALLVTVKNYIHFQYEERNFSLTENHIQQEPLIYRKDMVAPCSIPCSYYPANMVIALAIFTSTTLVFVWISVAMFRI